MLYSKMYVPFRIDLYLIVYLLNVRRSPIDLITNGNNNKSTMMMDKTFKWKFYMDFEIMSRILNFKSGGNKSFISRDNAMD